MAKPKKLKQPLPERLSVQIQRIAERCRSDVVSVKELLNTLRGSPYLLLIALLTLPFLLPVSIPGTSIPSGVIIFLFGIRIALGQKAVIPQGILKLNLPQKLFAVILTGASKLIQGLELLTKPRWMWLSERGVLINIYGVVIMFSALLLMLPIPIPFSNFFPALTLLLLSLGLIERDGVFILLGLLALVATLAFFTLLWWGGKELFEHIWQPIKDAAASGAYGPEKN